MTSLDIRQQYDKIYRFCYFRLKNSHLAEDITQETFLKYCEHYEFSSDSEVLKILYTIAGNLCIDEFRKTKPVAIEDDIQSPSHEDDVIENLSVRKALSRLKAEEQELLLLRYANDLKIGVIAGILKISRFAVRRKILAAKEHLKAELMKEGTYE